MYKESTNIYLHMRTAPRALRAHTECVYHERRGRAVSHHAAGSRFYMPGLSAAALKGTEPDV